MKKTCALFFESCESAKVRCPHRPWSLNDWVQRGVEVLDQKGINRAIAAGYAWGSVTPRFASQGLFFNKLLHTKRGLRRLRLQVQETALIFARER